jgi:hypothetical protein
MTGVSNLLTGSGYYTADEDYTDYTGFYLLEDPDWASGTYYRVDVHYERDGYPFTAILTGETGSTPFESTTSWFISSTQYNQRPNTSVNSVGDTTSTAGNLATYWKTAHDAAEAIEDEGDDRLRHLTGETGYDLITLRYYDVVGPSKSNCSTSAIHIDLTDARNSTVAHELGHQYHARVVGCDNGAAVFPIFQWDPHHYKTAEGISLTESVAQITALITWWDPDTAETEDVYDDFADCALNSDNWDNSNRASADRNNYLALWEYIDTSTTQPWVTDWDDNVDVTLTDMMDSLIAWFDWTSSTCRDDGGCWTGEKCLEDIESTKRCHGRNRTAQERWMEDAGTNCTPKDSEQCDPGEVCSPGGVCFEGDPHGGNIRDWAYHLGVELSISATYITHVLWQTECIGYNDDAFPFDGGYHYE